jgi:DNA polymerase I-like protein with 3'-5' exonuclease and polymerase domains
MPYGYTTMPSLKSEEHARALARVDFDYVSGPHQASLLRRRLDEIAEAGGIMGVDTETTGLDPRANQVRLVQLGTADFALIVDLDGWRAEGERHVPWDAPGLRELKTALEAPTPKVLQNAAFDLNFLRGERLVLGGRIFDTMVAAKIVNNGTGAKNDLGSIVNRVLKVPLAKELQKADWSGEISAEMLEYAARDVVCLPRLVPELREALQQSKTGDGHSLWEIFVLEMEVVRPIATMQWHGFGFDEDGAKELEVRLIQEADALQVLFLENLDQQIKANHPNDPHVWLPREPDGRVNTREKDSGSKRLGTKVYKGFNPRSPKQMAARFEQAGIMLPPDEKGAPSLDQNLLAFLRNDYELINQYMEWKTSVTKVSNIQKLLESIGPDGRIHCNYRQMGTETGRLSAASPNLQQVNRGKDFRSKFLAAPGYLLVVADFSQIELRMAGELSQEERMLAAYRAGRDLHTETAALMTGVSLEEVSKEARTSAKVANFGLLYGAGPATLQKQAIAQYGIDMSIDEAREIVEGFRSAYPRLYDWQREEGNRTTAAVFTKLGRRRMLVGFNDKYTTRINTQVQGSAGDIAKLAIARLWREICRAPVDEVKLIAMVHDEIVLEVREEKVEHWASVLKASMESAGSEICTSVPIVAEVAWGPTWADAK